MVILRSVLAKYLNPNNVEWKIKFYFLLKFGLSLSLLGFYFNYIFIFCFLDVYSLYRLPQKNWFRGCQSLGFLTREVTLKIIFVGWKHVCTRWKAHLSCKVCILFICMVHLHLCTENNFYLFWRYTYVCISLTFVFLIHIHVSVSTKKLLIS